MIDVSDLHFTYSGSAEAAVRGVAFAVARGEIFGLLGPSGAGKPTTQKILVGLLEGYPAAGRRQPGPLAAPRCALDLRGLPPPGHAVVACLGVAIDPIDLRAYVMARASPAATLLLGAAFAAVAAQPRLLSPFSPSTRNPPRTSTWPLLRARSDVGLVEEA